MAVQIDQPAVRALHVVVPPFDVQEKIAAEAMNQQSKAIKLRQEVDSIVEKAKEEVVRILLAED